MKNILVTGGAGYIGSHTAVELLNKGYRVTILDNLSNSRAEVLHSIEKITGKRPDFFELDLCDRNSLEHFFNTQKIDACIHFAAYKAVGESVDEPLKYYRNNLLSLINLAELMIEKKTDHLVFSSSCSVYGEQDKLPVNENSPLPKAESPYGNTKQIGEEILADTVKVNPFNVIALRYFNPAGAHESALIGEYPIQPPNNLVPVITQTAIGKRKSMTVFGSDYSTPDGTCIRDYIHVVDIAKAHVVAIERLIHKKNKNRFEVFNLGTGTGHSVMEAIHAFEKATNVKLNYTIGEKRAGDVEKVWADTELANQELGWKAALELEDIMQSAWKWELKLKEEAGVEN
ncbi:MAG: UDP-glucose 4-epimerase GalE [Bacteroidetes bacterium]|nr:UDP-glucose 4-epimerase GalE [Bacteroidota bacterium]